jgi:hypothetical protein
MIYLTISGTKFYGIIDDIGNNTYVATRFWHVYFFPVFYKGTYLCWGNPHEKMNYLRIPISWRSILTIFLRPLSFLFLVVGVLFFIVAIGDTTDKTYFKILVLAILQISLGVGGFFLYGKLKYTSPARKRELSRFLKSFKN